MRKILVFMVALVLSWGFALSAEPVQYKGVDSTIVVDTLEADTVAQDTVGVLYSAAEAVPGCHSYQFKRCHFQRGEIAPNLNGEPLKKGGGPEYWAIFRITTKKIFNA